MSDVTIHGVTSLKVEQVIVDAMSTLPNHCISEWNCQSSFIIFSASLQYSVAKLPDFPACICWLYICRLRSLWPFYDFVVTCTRISVEATLKLCWRPSIFSQAVYVILTDNKFYTSNWILCSLTSWFLQATVYPQSYLSPSKCESLGLTCSLEMYYVILRYHLQCIVCEFLSTYHLLSWVLWVRVRNCVSSPWP